MQQVLDEYRKEDPVLLKELPLEADIPEFLVNTGYAPEGSDLNKAIGDLSLIAYYYLVCVREYTTKSKHENTKQTVQFKMEDIRFFTRNKPGCLHCLLQDAPDQLIAMASGAALMLDNQKNGWEGVCIYHEENGDNIMCPVQALRQRFSVHTPTEAQRKLSSLHILTKGLNST